MTFSLLTKDELPDLTPFFKRTPIKLDLEDSIWGWGIKKINEGNPDFLIPVERDPEGRIVSASVCYSLDAALGVSKKVIPYWVLGMTRSWSTIPIASRLDALFTETITYFENKGYTSFYTSRLVLPSMTYLKAETGLTRAQYKIGLTRYTSQLELLASDPKEVEDMPAMYRMIAHRQWDPAKRKMAIIRHDLRYSDR
jgi:hypothetical protein